MRDEEWWRALGGPTHVHANLWRSPLPATLGHFKELKDAGVRHVFSLEEAVRGAAAEHAGLRWWPHYWTDHHPPKPHELDAFLAAYAAIPRDEHVVVHCRAGWGRTGTAIACALVKEHAMSAEDALTLFWSKVKDERVPPYMKQTGQADFVRGYHARLKGRGL